MSIYLLTAKKSTIKVSISLIRAVRYYNIYQVMMEHNMNNIIIIIIFLSFISMSQMTLNGNFFFHHLDDSLLFFCAA